jgi:hypothetical protein
MHAGEASARAGRLEEGLAYTRRALTAAEDHGEDGTEAWIHRLLVGELAALRVPPDPTAQDHYQRALNLAEQLGMRPLVAHCHLGLGQLHASPDYLARAVALYREMDMGFWLEKAETALKEVAPPAAQV